MLLEKFAKFMRSPMGYSGTSEPSPLDLQKKKIFIYIDSPGQLAVMSATADMLRTKLDAEITIMMIDTPKYFNESLADFEIYDLSSLMAPISDLKPYKSPRCKLSIPEAFDEVTSTKPSWLSAQRLKLKKFCFVFGHWRKKRRRNIHRYLSTLAGHTGRVAHYAAKLRYFLWSQLANVKSNFIAGKFWFDCTRSISGFLRVVKPDLIIVSEDNIENLTRIFIARGEALNIPAIVLPNTLPNPLEPAQFYFDDPRHNVKNPMMRALIPPKWRFQHAGKEMIRLPLSKIIAVEFLGISTPAPWVLNRGSSRSIALDSEMQKKSYLALDFPSDQLSVIGDLNGEQLWRGLSNKAELRKALGRKHGMDMNKPLVLCGFPPNQYSSSSTGDFEYPTFKKLVDQWMMSFHAISDRANIFICPQPRLDPAMLARYSTSSLRILSAPTIEMIPLCDLYVASISATIRWAISCGIPVVNYDCYRYRYGDFKNAPGVIETDNHNEFQIVLERFIDDPKFAATQQKKQQSVMKSWGMVDAHNSDRLAELAQTIMQSGTPFSKNIEITQQDVRL